VKISFVKKLFNKMPHLREIQKQQIKKPQITEISQNLNSNYLRKGDLDALETKLDLKLQITNPV